MKDERAFLRYRREVVQAWPDSARKTVFLAAIESRFQAIQQESQMVSFAARHMARPTDLEPSVPNWDGRPERQYTPLTSPPSTASATPVM